MRPLLPFIAGASLSFILLSCSGSTVRPSISLEELSKQSSIPVTVEGRVRPAYLSEDSCVYSEWAYGPMDDDASVTLIPAYQTSDSITVATSYGTVKLDIFNIKLYLGAFFSRTFSPENMSIAPLPVQKLLEEKQGIIAVHEFLLQPEQTYFAQVRKVDQRDSETETTGARYIMEISDMPFNGSTPQRNPTPSYK